MVSTWLGAVVNGPKQVSTSLLSEYSDMAMVADQDSTRRYGRELLSRLSNIQDSMDNFWVNLCDNSCMLLCYIKITWAQCSCSPTPLVRLSRINILPLFILLVPSCQGYPLQRVIHITQEPILTNIPWFLGFREYLSILASCFCRIVLYTLFDDVLGVNHILPHSRVLILDGVMKDDQG